MTRNSIQRSLMALTLLMSSLLAHGADINESVKLLPNANEGAALDRMGQSVAVSGNTAVVGSYLANASVSIADAGAVNVFLRAATGWTRQAKITPPSAEALDLFGNAVAISGDTIAIAAVQDDEGASSNAGAVYVFLRSGTAWSLQQRIVASDPSANAGFGRSVTIDGDTLVVGAHRANGGTGAAYAFTRSGTVWTQRQRLLAQDAANGDYFGGSVSISGDRLVVGAERADIGASIDAGAAYAFERIGNGTWRQQTKLTPSTFTNADDNFGISVSVSGSSIAVGQPYLGTGADSNKGAVIVFVEQAGAWVREATLVASDAKANDFLGRSVSISGDTIVAGSYFDDVGTVVNGGSAYLFRRSGSNWSQADRLLGSDTARNDLMGSAVAVSSGVTVLGAPLASSLAFGAESGAAYAYTRNDGTSLSLAVNNTAITYGQGVTLTARIDDSSFDANPSGSITFYNGSTAIGTSVIDGSGQAQLSFPNPGAGDLALSARFAGNASFLASTSPIRTVSVAKAATSVSMTPPAATTVQYGTNLTYTANLTVAGAPIPTGNIRFLDGINVIGTAAMSAGVASININTLSVGAHSIRAEYSGDANYLGFATAPAAITVTKATVSIALTTTPSPSIEGDSVRMFASLSGGIPTGLRVGFEMMSPSSLIIGEAFTDANGVARIDTGVLTTGTYQFRATFFGDSSHFSAVDLSDTHSVLAAADLTITKSNGETHVQSGSTTVYTIVVTNSGPNDVVGATVIDNIDDDSVTGLFLPNAPWTCFAVNGAACTGGSSGQGDVSQTVNIPVSGSVTITVTAQTRTNAEPFISNTATVVLPSNRGDRNLQDNISTDADASGVFNDGFETVQ